jgi:hypothetical protein
MQQTRSITISTRVTASEKAQLINLSHQFGVSPSELYYTLIINFKEHYRHIGEGSPIVMKLEHELERTTEELVKLGKEKDGLMEELGRVKEIMTLEHAAFLEDILRKP